MALEDMILTNGASVTTTPTCDDLPRVMSDFATLGAALDYAAAGVRGLNFHDARGNALRAYPFAELQIDACAMARRLMGRGVAKGDRIALIAETGAEFATLFFGCIYAGAWPVPLPLPTSFGGRDSYVDQLSVQLASSDPKMLFYPAELAAMAGAAAEAKQVEGHAWEDAAEWPEQDAELPESFTDDIAYLQYSSGSTRFPHGVAVTHRQLLANLAAHGHGMALERPTAAYRGCPGIMTWGWSAACSPQSRTRFRPTTSRPRILRGVRLPGLT